MAWQSPPTKLQGCSGPFQHFFPVEGSVRWWWQRRRGGQALDPPPASRQQKTVPWAWRHWRCQLREISTAERVWVQGGGLGGTWREKGQRGGRWASGEGGGWAPRVLSSICKALYHSSGIFPTWRPNGLAGLGNPEGKVLGKGEGLPCTQQLLLEVLSAPRDSHGAAHVPRLPARQLPGLHAGLALPAPGPYGCHLSSPRAFVFSGQVDVSQEGIRSLEKGGVGSWPPALKNSRLFPISL